MTTINIVSFFVNQIFRIWRKSWRPILLLTIVQFKDFMLTGLDTFPEPMLHSGKAKSFYFSALFIQIKSKFNVNVFFIFDYSYLNCRSAFLFLVEKCLILIKCNLPHMLNIFCIQNSFMKFSWISFSGQDIRPQWRNFSSSFTPEFSTPSAFAAASCSWTNFRKILPENSSSPWASSTRPSRAWTRTSARGSTRWQWRRWVGDAQLYSNSFEGYIGDFYDQVFEAVTHHF